MDQTPPEQPSQEPLDGAGSSQTPDQDIALVLEEASQLAAELARELDGDEPPPLAAAAPGNLSEAPEVDRQLDDIDALLAMTTDEVGEEPAEGGAHIQPKLSAEEAASAVPDFMDEFTDHGNADDTSSEPRPGVVGTGKANVLAPEATKAQPAVEDGPASIATRRKVPDPRELLAKVAKQAAITGRNLLPRLLPVADRAVGVLEKGDRPFGWMKDPIRRAVGWLALATLGTSVFVFLWSLI